MTDKTINALTATTTAVAADEIPMWVAGSAVTRKITRANFLAGYGALATASTWTAAQTFSAAINIGNSSNKLLRYDAGIVQLLPGETFALAANAVYTFAAKPGGIVIILDGSSGHYGMFTARAGGNATTEVAESGSNFSVTKDNAGTINFYFDTSAYYIQNKHGSSRTLSVLLLGMMV